MSVYEPTLTVRDGSQDDRTEQNRTVGYAKKGHSVRTAIIDVSICCVCVVPLSFLYRLFRVADTAIVIFYITHVWRSEGSNTW